MDTIDYPANIGTNASMQPFMLLTSYESKNAIESVGQQGRVGQKNYVAGKAISSIALYIPPNALKTQYTANWEGLEGGALRAAAGGAISDLISGEGKASFLGIGGTGEGLGYAGMGTFLWEGLKSAGVGFMGKAARQLEKTTGFLSAAHGIAVNNHLALTYRGVTKFREHSFTFNFFPKNDTDAEKIRLLLKDFRNGMLPRMGGGKDRAVMQKGNRLSAPFFSSPRHWTIDFNVPGMEENEFLFRIGKSVITAMDVNHDPNSTVSLHSDGSPVQTTLTLSFQEIEIQVSDDEATEHSKEQKAAVNKGIAQQNALSDPFGPEKRGSDFRLKDNITLLQEEGFGIPNIYSFNYKWDTETTWIGVMAQELFDIGYSDAVGIDSEGFYNVDYSKLGFPMIGFK